MTAHLYLIASVCMLGLTSGCGGITDDASIADSGPPGADAGEPNGEDAPWDGGALNPLCPGEKPGAATTCPGPVTCEYGDAWWNPHCDTIDVCAYAGALWDVKPPTSDCSAPPPNASGCPPTPRAGTACTPDASPCYYGYAGECDCLAHGDAGATWACDPGPGCPSERPRLGTPCVVGPPMCGYFGTLYVCDHGAWAILTGGP